MKSTSLPRSHAVRPYTTNSGSQCRFHKEDKRMKTTAPTLVSFAVTRECNLKCKHCYSQSIDSPHPRELDTAEAKRLIDQIAETGARLIILDGGEPLMRSDILTLVRQ